MSLSIVELLPDDYKLVKDFKSKGKIKLYRKGDSYICSMITPILDPDEVIYIKIDANEKQLIQRRTQPLGFCKEECITFITYLNDLADSIQNGLEDEKSHIQKMQVEHICMVFWANRAMIFVNKNRLKGIWDNFSDLLYSLSQMIYLAFDVAQKQCILEQISPDNEIVVYDTKK